jgi:hypothetical protein
MRATRRRLLTVAGWAALPAGLVSTDDPVTPLARRLTGLLREPESARRIAAAWLASIGETDPRRAARDLDMEKILAPLDGIAGTTAARAWLGARIRADFAEGAVLDVDGWRLSRTEVGACLLATGMA